MKRTESRLVLRQHIVIRQTGKELIVDNSFKCFANYREN